VSLAFTNLPWTGATSFEVYRVDAEHELDRSREGEIPPGGRLEITHLAAPTVTLIKLRPKP
jgi:hypothetical protein